MLHNPGQLHCADAVMLPQQHVEIGQEAMLRFNAFQVNLEYPKATIIDIQLCLQTLHMILRYT